MLLELGQAHLFEDWPDPGVEDDLKKALLDQVVIFICFLLGGLIYKLGVLNFPEKCA